MLSQGNDIVGLIAHQSEVLLSGSQTEGLAFDSYPLTEKKRLKSLELF